MGQNPQDEDDMIENLIQNPPPSVLHLEDIVRETQNNLSTDLCVVDLTSPYVKNIGLAQKEP